MKILRFIIRWLIRIVFLGAILLAFFWVRTSHIIDYLNGPSVQKKEVALTDPREANFQWKYAGNSYAISKTLYGSLYQFYQESPKTYQYQGTLPTNWEADYYAMFLQKNEQDDSIVKIAATLKELGAKKNLKADQLVELTVAFVQAIPYDDVRAKEILANAPAGRMNYPYEVLYEDKGICSDKSFLLANLLKEMGYGTAIFVYDNEKHMAVGIQCSQEYSSYNSGYCYVETTSEGFKIGVIPDIDPEKGSAVAIQELGQFNSQLNQFNVAKLGEVKIYPQSQGKVYAGIIQSIAQAKEIDSLRATIQTLGKNLKNLNLKISAQQDQLTQMNKQLKNLEKSGDYKTYNNLVDDYNKIWKDYKNQIKNYNTQVADYNKKVKQYNSLIKSA